MQRPHAYPLAGIYSEPVFFVPPDTRPVIVPHYAPSSHLHYLQPFPAAMKVPPHSHSLENPRHGLHPMHRSRTEYTHEIPLRPNMQYTRHWVNEQEYNPSAKRSRRTEEWLRDQIGQDYGQRREGRSNSRHGTGVGHNDFLYTYETETERWRRQQIEARIAAAEHEQMKARIIREQAMRIEAQARQRREEGKRRMAEERYRLLAEMKDNHRREPDRGSGLIAEAWKYYDTSWTGLVSSTTPLRFQDIPWPLVHQPSNPSQIEPANIRLFILSNYHSEGISRKDRIRNAQLRWHPDRFRRVLSRVVEQDKAAVEEGVGVISRCLNELMGREKSRSRHAQQDM